MKMKSQILFILYWLVLASCSDKNLAYSTFEVMESSSPTPTYPEYQDLPTQTPMTPKRIEQTISAEISLTRTPEAEGLVPGYKPEAWAIYLITVPGMDLPYASGHGLFVVHEIEEDEIGVFWMGTSHGLVRFDGMDWSLVATETQVIGGSDVEIADDGSVWFTLSDGIYKYIDENVFLMYELADNQTVSAMDISPSGDIWVAIWSYMANEILVHSNHHWETLSVENGLPFESISDLVFDSEGRIYIWGMTGPPYISSGFAYYEEDEWVVFDKSEHYGIMESNGFYVSSRPLVVDEQDHVWFFLQGQGLYEFYDDQFYLRAPVYDDVYGYYDPGPMVFDHNGVLWLGDFSLGSYLTKYVPSTDRFQSIDGSYEFYIYSSDPEELPSSRYIVEHIIPFGDVYSLFVDSGNILWIGTRSGIFTFDLE